MTPDELDVAAVRAQVGPDALQRRPTRCLDLVRVQAVHQQQARDQVVGDQRVLQPRVQPPGIVERSRSIRSSPAPYRSVTSRDRAPRHAPGRHGRRCARRLEQLLDPLPGPPQRVGRDVRGIAGRRRASSFTRRSATGWASAAAPASCRRRGTCARRTAGRGRSCAPCA